MSIWSSSGVAGLGTSSVLALSEQIDARRAAGESITKLTLGQSPFPVPEAMVATDCRAARRARRTMGADGVGGFIIYVYLIMPFVGSGASPPSPRHRHSVTSFSVIPERVESFLRTSIFYDVPSTPINGRSVPTNKKNVASGS